MNKKINSVVFWLFVITLAGVAIVMVPQFYLKFELAKVVFFRGMVSLIWIFLALRLMFSNRLNLQLDKKALILFGLNILVLVLATVFAAFPHLSFFGSYFRQQGLLQLIYYWLFFIAALIYFSGNKEKLIKLFKYLCFAAVLVSLVAILQKFFPVFNFGLIAEDFLGRVFGTMGHPNFLAAYLTMMVPFIIYFLRRDVRPFLWAIILGIVLLAIVLTLSRAAFMGIAAILFFLALNTKHKKVLLVPIFMGLVVLFLNLFQNYLPQIENSFLNRLIFREEAARSVNVRLMIWPETLKMIREKPLLGYGLENYSEAFTKFFPKNIFLVEDFRNTADKAHNEILDTASTSGIVGVTVWLMFLVYLFMIGLKKKNDLFVLSLLSSIFALFVINMFGFPITVNYVYFWLICAGIIALCGNDNLKIHIKKSLAVIIFAVIILIFVVANYLVVFKPAYAEFYYNEAMQTATKFKRMSTLGNFKRALEENGNEIYYAIRGAEYALLAAEDISEDRNFYINEAESFLKILVEKNCDQMIRPLISSAEIMALEGDFHSANKIFEKVEKRAPNYPNLFLKWADLLTSEENYQEAVKKYEKFFDLLPDYENDYERKRIFLKNHPEILGIVSEYQMVKQKTLAL